jgi:hypothetical protein
VEFIVAWLIFLALVWIGSNVRKVADRMDALQATLERRPPGA